MIKSLLYSYKEKKKESMVKLRRKWYIEKVEKMKNEFI